MPFNSRFVNEAGTDLVKGKIHTIRLNYAFWKRFEDRDVALYIWEGTPYRSKQRVFCVKHIYHVQKVCHEGMGHFCKDDRLGEPINMYDISVNDGFRDYERFMDWFADYPDDEMGIVHFTDFRY
jgi:hypothetical protein